MTLGRPAVGRRTILQSLGLGAIAVAGLSACSSREAASRGDTTGDSAEISVTDQAGNTIKLDGPAQRIATTVIPSPAMLIALAQKDDPLVAVNQAAQLQAEAGMLAKMFPRLLQLPVASGRDFVPAVETVLRQNPDLVIQWGDQGNDIVKPLRDAGLKVMLLRYGTQEDLETWIELFGKVLGTEDRADHILSMMRADRKTVENAVAGKARPRVLPLFSYTESKISGKNSYMDFWVNLCGGVNVAGDVASGGTSLQVTKEEIVSWNPEVIFVGNFDPAAPAAVMADRLYGQTDAVRNKRVYKMPNGGFAWYPPSVESNLQWLWTTELIHPNSTGVGLRERLVKDYSYLYGYDLTPEDLDLVLAVAQNKESANYDVFR